MVGLIVVNIDTEHKLDMLQNFITVNRKPVYGIS